MHMYFRCGHSVPLLLTPRHATWDALEKRTTKYVYERKIMGIQMLLRRICRICQKFKRKRESWMSKQRDCNIDFCVCVYFKIHFSVMVLHSLVRLGFFKLRPCKLKCFPHILRGVVPLLVFLWIWPNILTKKKLWQHLYSHFVSYVHT